MASHPSSPLCQIPLHPFLDAWSGGPGRSFVVIRFGTWASLRLEGGEEDEPVFRAVVQAMLHSEMPFAVLPAHLRESHRVLCHPIGAETWQGALPVWRGIPCLAASTTVRFRNPRANRV
jgi:hypothetical protein